MSVAAAIRAFSFCSSADDHCAAEEPPLIERGPGQKAACWKEPSTWVK